MCDKNMYREQGYTPRKPDELYEQSPMNPKNKKTWETKEMQFIEETMR